MFSQEEKQKIAEAVENVLKDLHHPEMPLFNLDFELRVNGQFHWSYATILPNWKFGPSNPPVVNQWNELMAAKKLTYRNLDGSMTVEWLDDKGMVLDVVTYDPVTTADPFSTVPMYYHNNTPDNVDDNMPEDIKEMKVRKHEINLADKEGVFDDEE